MGNVRGSEGGEKKGDLNSPAKKGGKKNASPLIFGGRGAEDFFEEPLCKY